MEGQLKFITDDRDYLLRKCIRLLRQRLLFVSCGIIIGIGLCLLFIELIK